MLKKTFALFLTATLLLTGCGGKKQQDNGGPANAQEVLQSVWDTFSDEEKFPVYGGDSANMVDGGPGNFDIADTEGLRYNLLVPEAQIASVAQAASMTHGMMVNNFTCGVFRLTEGTSAKAFADAMAQSYKDNQWLCGTPEQMLVATIGDGCVVSAFGLTDVLSVFRQKLTAVYPDAQILHTQTIA